MKRKHIQHLYWRIGFGILPDQLAEISKKSKKDIVNSLIQDSKKDTPITLDISEMKDLLANKRKNDKEKAKKLQDLSKKKKKELNIAWIDRLKQSKELLRERMTLFWANHFVCDDNVYPYMEKYHNTLRQYALGNFKDFVVAISKEAAMTKYLNTKQNKKEKPNENFARELMELFTLGVGNYTEEDIKESARAFTGYRHGLMGDFVFNTRHHDAGSKTFFGKSGNFKGDDIIDIILEKEQCANYICTKIYRYFVNDTINESHVKAMTNVFYKDYDIENLMRYVLMSDWFYDDDNIGTKIKSPIEFLVGLNTIVPVEFTKPKQLLYLQKLMGQILLAPPNVAGWKGGRNWIDSNTITLRLKLPSLLLNGAYISKTKKGEIDINAKAKKQAFKDKHAKRFKVESDWSYFNTHFKNVDVEQIEGYVLSCNINENTKQYLQSLQKVSKQEYCVQIMSLPEYQMC